jgi:hypothetical protein
LSSKPEEMPMVALLSLVVCLSSMPAVCETVTPDYVDRVTGEPPSFHECLGIGGQGIALRWLSEHPGYRLHRVQCSVASDARLLRERIESPRA